MKCWVCHDIIKTSYLLPEQDDSFMIPKDPMTYEIKTLRPFIFLYYNLCLKCMNSYVANFPFYIKLKNRETNIKKCLIN
jgi:hypothetical protein